MSHTWFIYFFLVNKWSQMVEESVMKHKCKAWNHGMKKRNNSHPVRSWIAGFAFQDPFIIMSLFWDFLSLTHFSLFISFSFTYCLPHEVVITLKSGNKIKKSGKHTHKEHLAMVCCRVFFWPALNCWVFLFLVHAPVCVCECDFRFMASVSRWWAVGFVCLAAEG